MIIVFKCLGAFFGLRVALALGSPPLSGLIVGAILGHSLDIIVSTKLQRAKARRYFRARASAEYHQLFLHTVFSMLGKLAIVDGAVQPQELLAVEKIISETLRLKRRERREAIQIFQRANKSSTSFQYDAAQFFEVHQQDPTSLENFLYVLFSLAGADGSINEAEEKILHSAAIVFNVPEVKFEEIRSRFLGSRKKTNANGTLSAADPYAVLGCNRSDSVKIIKQNYRKLVSDYHPDKILSKDLPEDFTAFATEKFKAIQEAYEFVKAEKGFS